MSRSDLVLFINLRQLGHFRFMLLENWFTQQFYKVPSGRPFFNRKIIVIGSSLRDFDFGLLSLFYQKVVPTGQNQIRNLRGSAYLRDNYIPMLRKIIPMGQNPFHKLRRSMLMVENWFTQQFYKALSGRPFLNPEIIIRRSSLRDFVFWFDIFFYHKVVPTGQIKFAISVEAHTYGIITFPCSVKLYPRNNILYAP